MLKILPVLILLLLLGLYLRTQPPHHGRRRAAMGYEPPVLYRRAPKPEWVRLEIIRLKAMMPDKGCRKLAEIFNRLYGHRGDTVGKTYVSGVLCKYRYEIEAQRKRVRNRRHKPTSLNRIWGLDLTFVTDEQAQSHPVLGMVDHGTRANLALVPLKGKSALNLLLVIHAAVTLYGRPRVIRTDNEGMFKSWLFRFGPRLFGIRHQLIDPHCPWQNGRIERFFGTFKQKWNRWSVANREQLETSLRVFRVWYNHVRPHQHLQGMTPAEVWAGTDIRRQRPKEAVWFDAWDGLLTGYYIRR